MFFILKLSCHCSGYSNNFVFLHLEAHRSECLHLPFYHSSSPFLWKTESGGEPSENQVFHKAYLHLHILVLNLILQLGMPFSYCKCITKKKKQKCVKAYLSPFVSRVYCCLSFLGFCRNTVGDMKGDQLSNAHEWMAFLRKQKHKDDCVNYSKYSYIYFIPFLKVFSLKSYTLDLKHYLSNYFELEIT